MAYSDSPFVSEMYSKRQKKCRGCVSMFVIDSPKFVICHEEWMGARKRRRRMTQNIGGFNQRPCRVGRASPNIFDFEVFVLAKFAKLQNDDVLLQ